MAEKIDPAIVKQLTDRGAAVYDMKGFNLDASLAKLKGIKAGTSKPVSVNNIERGVNVVSPGPTPLRLTLPKEEPQYTTLDKSKQKLTQLAMAKQVIDKNVALGAKEQSPLTTITEAGKRFAANPENALKLGKVLSSPTPIVTAGLEFIPDKTKLKFAADVVRAPVRALTSVGIEPVAGAINKQPIYVPSTKAEKMLFGDEPIVGVFKRNEEAQNWLNQQFAKQGVSKDASLGMSFALAPIFVAGSVGLDLTPFGGEKNGAKLIAKSKNVDEIFGLLKPMFKNEGDDVVRSFAGELVNVTDAKKVQDFIAKKVAQSLRPKIGQTIKLAEEGVDAEKQFNILQEMKMAEAGKRVLIQDAVTGAKSKVAQKYTFPEWIPTELRARKTLESVVKHIEAGTVPTKFDDTRLYNVVAERMGQGIKKVDEAAYVDPPLPNFGDDAAKVAAEVPPTVVPNEATPAEQALTRLNERPPVDVADAAASMEPEKQRKFVTTVLNSDKTSPELKEAIAKLPTADKNYDPITNKAILDEAREFVEKDYQVALDYFNTTNKIDARYSAVGQSLAKKAAQEGRIEEATGIIKELFRLATEKGQFTQAFALWDKMTPEGMLKYAQREIDNTNEEIGKKFLGLGKKLFNKLPDLSKEDAEFIVNKMKSLEGVTDETKKARIIKEVMEKISDNIPLGFNDYFTAYRYQNMLSSPRTQLRNIYFNLAQTYMFRPAQMVFEAPIDMVRARYTGTPQEKFLKDIPTYYKNVFNSFGASIDALAQTWKGNTPIDVMNPDLNRLKLDKLPKSLSFVQRAMEGMDQFFKANMGAGVKAVALSHGKTEAEAIAEATRISNYSLLKGATDAKNKTGQGAFLSGIDDATNAFNGLVKRIPLFNWFVPFVNTPMKFAKMWAEHTPGVGLFTLPGHANKTEQLAKQAMGSLVMLYGAKQAWDGNTTWSAPKGEADKQLFYASGKKPYSVRIGDRWVPMIYFGPLALALAIPAAAKYNFEDSPDAMNTSSVQKSLMTLAGSMELFANQTFLVGLDKYINLLSGGEDYDTGAAAAFTAAQTLPMEGFAKWVNEFFIDKTFRKANGFDEGLKKSGFLNLMTAGGLSKSLNPVESVGGETSERTLQNAFLPFDIMKHNDTYDSLIEKRTEAAQIRAKNSKEQKQVDQEMSNLAREFKTMDPAKRKETIKEIYAKGGKDLLVDLLDTLKKSKEAKALELNFYKGLEVKTGMRAYFLKQELDRLGDDKEAKREFLKEMAKEKILNVEVMKQITKLK